MSIVNYEGRLGKFSYDDEEYKISDDIKITYIGKSSNPSYLEGCINYSYTFMTRKDITELDLSHWDTSKVENISFMFYGCHNLKDIKGLENWIVSNVKNMSYVFYGCDNLKEIKGLENWDVSNVEDVDAMFGDCHNLKKIKGLENWDVSKVKDMSFMFFNCYKLNEIKGLENWTINISDIDNLECMFFGWDNVPEWYIILKNNLEIVIDGDILEYDEILLLNKEV